MTRLLVIAIGVLFASAVAAAAQDEEVFKAGAAGITLPKPTHEERPQYTKEAMAAGIQGSVLLTAVVQKDGTVGQVNIVKSLDKVYGLDESAIACVRQWRFEPGKKDGKAVAVEVHIELTFSLRKKDEK